MRHRIEPSLAFAVALLAGSCGSTAPDSPPRATADVMKSASPLNTCGCECVAQLGCSCAIEDQCERSVNKTSVCDQGHRCTLSNKYKRSTLLYMGGLLANVGNLARGLISTGTRKGWDFVDKLHRLNDEIAEAQFILNVGLESGSSGELVQLPMADFSTAITSARQLLRAIGACSRGVVLSGQTSIPQVTLDLSSQLNEVERTLYEEQL